MSGFYHRFKSLTTLVFLLASGLSLASCGGSGNTFGNGSGSPTSATAANSVAGIDIANGNYSAAISVLTPFCPNNNCQNSDLANTLANAYMAMGNSSASASVTGTTSVTGASGGGATVSQILSNVLNLVSGGASTSTTAIIQAIFQAVPCISNNTCTQTYLDNLATAIEILANTPCTGSTSVADNCPDSSTIIVADMLYILAAAQYNTGVTYLGGSFQVCPASGGGTSGCSTLGPSSLTTTMSFPSAYSLGNIGEILDSLSVSGSSATITINNANIVNVLPYFLTSFGSSNNSNIVGPIYLFLNSIGCYTSVSSTCLPSNEGSTSVSINSFSESQLINFLNNAL